jgi:hypothetical protein
MAIQNLAVEKKHSAGRGKLTKNKTRIDGKTKRNSAGTVGERLY